MKLYEKLNQLNTSIEDVRNKLQKEISKELHISIRKNYNDKLQICISETLYSCDTTNINIEDWEKVKETIDELLNKEE